MRHRWNGGNPVEISMLPASLKRLEARIGFQVITMNTFPHELEDLRLDGRCDQELVPGMLPASLKKLHLIECCHALHVGTLPDHLTHFTCNSFTSTFTPGIFPASLISFDLAQCTQTLAPGVIPFGVTDLTFHSTVHQDLGPGTFPTSVKRLFLAGHMTLQHDCIPLSATHLKLQLGSIVKAGVIPDWVTHLTLDIDCNEPVDVGVIPSSATHLEFSSRMKQPIALHTIPLSVTHLVQLLIHTVHETVYC